MNNFKFVFSFRSLPATTINENSRTKEFLQSYNTVVKITSAEINVFLFLIMKFFSKKICFFGMFNI